MSNLMCVNLETGSFPDDLIPDGSLLFGNGQGILHATDELSGVCRHFGLTPIDDFIVDPNDDRLTEALAAAGWVEVAPDRELERAGLPDPAFDAAHEWFMRFKREFEATGPWFEARDGLRTVAGLIHLLRKGLVPHSLRLQLWEARNRRRIDAGMDPDLVGRYYGPPDSRYSLSYCLMNLRTFEAELGHAVAIGSRFNYWISY